MKKKNERTVSKPDRRIATRGLYRALDRRKTVAEPDAVQLGARRFCRINDDTVEDFPASEYQRMYET